MILLSFIVGFIGAVVFWIITLKRITFENLVNLNLDNFKNYILITCYIVLAKGALILFIPQLRCGFERNINDFSYTCVILKSITTFGISVYLTRYLNKKLNFNNNYEVADAKKEIERYKKIDDIYKRNYIFYSYYFVYNIS